MIMRTERDSMGVMQVPEDVLYGASTQRAVLNFPISGRPLPPGFIRGLGLVKSACAAANRQLGRMPARKARLIGLAAQEVADSKLLRHFPVDVFQTGSGTSTNTNANEVIAHRAAQLARRAGGKPLRFHPNDDINLGQSSNDVIPTVLHVSVACFLQERLVRRWRGLGALAAKARNLLPIVKIGRTHLMDATPLTLGQEFFRLRRAGRQGRQARAPNNPGAGRTGDRGHGRGHGNQHPSRLRGEGRPDPGPGRASASARPAIISEAQGGRDDAVEVAGRLMTIAASLRKIANGLRLLGSGPRSGLQEIRLPATQPGSSIMPGKVNPVMSEMLVQVCLYTQGLGQAVVAAEERWSLRAQRHPALPGLRAA